ncbi:MAG: hypothetical protein PHO41_01695, partial [Eubacteriales bacterium]|nr:hypothetical protein [Eubacteriales bacterium]
MLSRNSGCRCNRLKTGKKRRKMRILLDIGAGKPYTDGVQAEAARFSPVGKCARHGSVTGNRRNIA